MGSGGLLEGARPTGRLLVVESRLRSHSRTHERRVIRGLARREGLEPVFVNPLLDQDWRGANILSKRSRRTQNEGPFAGTLWPGSSHIDLAIATDPNHRITDVAPDALNRVYNYMVDTDGLAKAVLEEEIPTLGLCLGHHRLNLAAGNPVGRDLELQESGTIDLHFLQPGEEEPLTSGLPNPTRIIAVHKDRVRALRTGIILGRTGRDPYAVTKLGHEAVTFQGHLEHLSGKAVEEAMEEVNRDVVDLENYVKTHEFRRPHNNRRVLARFMSGARNGSIKNAA